nr:agamous-like MADS-box protein AGL82 [Tanacetum cinerariifolium]
MGRAKLRMELLPKEKTRITTYHKRKCGIIKKAREFTILCDVDTLMIINPPNSNETEVWPKNPDQIKKGIASYKSKKAKPEKELIILMTSFKTEGKRLKTQFAAKLEQREHDARTRLEFKKRNMNITYPYTYNFGNMPSMYHFAGLGLGLGKPDPVLDHRHMLMNREPMAAHGYPSVEKEVDTKEAFWFVADRVFFAELNEVLPRELSEGVSSGVEVRVTHMRKKKRRIPELTSLVQKRFKFPKIVWSFTLNELTTEGSVPLPRPSHCKFAIQASRRAFCP